MREAIAEQSIRVDPLTSGPREPTEAKVAPKNPKGIQIGVIRHLGSSGLRFAPCRLPLSFSGRSFARPVVTSCHVGVGSERRAGISLGEVASSVSKEGVVSECRESVRTVLWKEPPQLPGGLVALVRRTAAVATAAHRRTGHFAIKI